MLYEHSLSSPAAAASQLLEFSMLKRGTGVETLEAPHHAVPECKSGTPKRLEASDQTWLLRDHSGTSLSEMKFVDNPNKWSSINLTKRVLLSVSVNKTLLPWTLVI